MKDYQQFPGVLPSPPVLFLFFVGAAAFLYLRVFLFPAIPYIATGDEVLFLLRALRILHGQVLYRDFLEIVPPGTDLLYAAIFRLFGVHLLVVQVWSIVFGLTCSVVITFIAKRILRGSLVLLPALLFLVFDFSSALDLTHHWYSTLASLSAVCVLMEEISLLRIIGASFLCGTSVLFTQTQGALTFIAIVLYLLWCRRFGAQQLYLWKQLIAVIVPFALIVACFLEIYVHKAGFRTLFFDLVLLPTRYMSSAEVNTPRTYLQQLPSIHRSSDALRFIPYLFIYAIVPYIYIWGGYRLWRGRKTLPTAMQQRLILLHLVGLALFLAIAHGPRYFRLCTVAPPAILVCVWLVSSESKIGRFFRRSLWSTAVVVAFVLPLHQQIRWHATLNLPVGRVAFHDEPMFQEFRWIAQRTHPSEPFFNHIGLSFYLALDNPTQSEFVNYDEFTRPEQVAAVVQSLRSSPPHFVILFPHDPYFSAAHDHSTPFLEYIHENYHLAKVFTLDHGSRYEELWALGRASGP